MARAEGSGGGARAAEGTAEGHTAVFEIGGCSGPGGRSKGGRSKGGRREEEGGGGEEEAAGPGARTAAASAEV